MQLISQLVQSLHLLQQDGEGSFPKEWLTRPKLSTLYNRKRQITVVHIEEGCLLLLLLLGSLLIVVCLFLLGIEPRASHTLGKCSIPKPHPQPPFYLSFGDGFALSYRLALHLLCSLTGLELVILLPQSLD